MFLGKITPNLPYRPHVSRIGLKVPKLILEMTKTGDVRQLAQCFMWQT